MKSCTRRRQKQVNIAYVNTVQQDATIQYNEFIVSGNDVLPSKCAILGETWIEHIDQKTRFAATG
jgi:hypothetical protein